MTRATLIQRLVRAWRNRSTMRRPSDAMRPRDPEKTIVADTINGAATSDMPTSRPARLRAAWQYVCRRRVPVILQQDSVECGAACLAMVLGYFGRRRALAQCRLVCDPGRDGLNAGLLADAARMLGLRVDAWIIHSATALISPVRRLPAIVHWQGDHFVVVEHVTARFVTIVDPAVGRRRLLHAVFDEECSGVALTCTPGPTFAIEADRDDPSVASAATWWRRFLIDLLNAREMVSVAGLLVIATLVLQASGLALPIATQLVVDHLIPGRLESPLAWLAGAGLLVVGSHILLRYVRGHALILLQARVDTRLTQRFLSHLLRLPYRVFQQRTPGDLLTRMSSLNTVRELITAHSLGMGLDGLFVTGYLVLLAVWSPFFAALAIVFCVLQMAVLALTRPALHRVTERHLTAQTEAHGCLVDAVRGIASVKVAGAETQVLDRWSTLFERQLELSERRQRLAAVFDAVLAGLRLGSTLAFLWFGAHEVLAGRLTVGTMLALNAIATGALMPLGSLVGSLQQVQMARAQLERVRDILETPLEQAPLLRAVRVTLTGELRVEHVCFRYHHGAPFVLEDISCAANAGAVIAIVGRSGSGKSTLARLLIGLHEPTSGRVLLDGLSLRALDYARVRRQCGVVLQDSAVFNMTVRENIAFGRPDLTFDDVVRAARIAELHEDIMRMPMGYDTSVLEAGSGLSGGQRQRLLIARAIAHGPALLILDEATSHLDAQMERRIMAALSALTCTRVLIAHRMVTTQDADLILVLEGGRIVEQGSPMALMRRGGVYAALVAEQRVRSPAGVEVDRA